MAERAPAPGATVEIADPADLMDERSRSWLVDRAHAATGILGCQGSVRVRLVNDAQMSAAHERYSGVPGTTDVLTFDLGRDNAASSHDPRPRALDVDVLVCVDVARREAEARGIDPRREVLLYIVHAVLHCVGEDDHDPQAAARMHAREDAILEAVGAGAVYALAPVRREQRPADGGAA